MKDYRFEYEYLEIEEPLPTGDGYANYAVKVVRAFAVSKDGGAPVPVSVPGHEHYGSTKEDARKNAETSTLKWIEENLPKT